MKSVQTWVFLISITLINGIYLQHRNYLIIIIISSTNLVYKLRNNYFYYLIIKKKNSFEDGGALCALVATKFPSEFSDPKKISEVHFITLFFYYIYKVTKYGLQNRFLLQIDLTLSLILAMVSPIYLMSMIFFMVPLTLIPFSYSFR